jgi:hypothetical protein
MIDRAFYTVREFCERNAISRRWFYVLVSRGDIWVVKAGRKTLVPVFCEKAWHERLKPVHAPVHVSNVHSSAQADTDMHSENASTPGRK